jgi:hypothetical protein
MARVKSSEDWTVEGSTDKIKSFIAQLRNFLATVEKYLASSRCTIIGLQKSIADISVSNESNAAKWKLFVEIVLLWPQITDFGNDMMAFADRWVTGRRALPRHLRVEQADACSAVFDRLRQMNSSLTSCAKVLEATSTQSELKEPTMRPDADVVDDIARLRTSTRAACEQVRSVIVTLRRLLRIVEEMANEIILRDDTTVGYLSDMESCSSSDDSFDDDDDDGWGGAGDAVNYEVEESESQEIIVENDEWDTL